MRIVDAQSGHVTKTFTEAGIGIITGLHWSPDGTRIALETQDTIGTYKVTVTLWSVQSGKLLYTFHSKHSIYDVVWSPDSQYLSCLESMEVKDKDGNSNYNANILIWVA